ncbi:hypothetical protein [Ferrimonas pelagia]
MDALVGQVVGNITSLGSKLDLTSNSHLNAIAGSANLLLAEGLTLFQLRQIESDVRWKDHLGFQLALKLALSRRCCEAIAVPTTLTVVFAMYKETERMMSPKHHQYGEDFIRRKVEQLDWLCADLPLLSWQMEIVDDGCPDGSGAAASRVIESLRRQEQVQVHYLQDAIDQHHEVVTGLSAVEQSRKGGSVCLGLANAYERDPSATHYVCYTDADLSTHLGQLGLLVQPLVDQKALVVCGSRREPQSVVLKEGVRNERGKLFIFLWKKLLPQLNFLVDTQCGFKAFRADLLPHVLKQRLENQFAFDIELLLRTQLHQADQISKVGIGWIDSDALSTTTDLAPYLSMLKAIVAMYRQYVPQRADADAFAALIDDLNENEWEALLVEMTPFLASHNLTELLASREVTPERLRQASLSEVNQRETLKVE